MKDRTFLKGRGKAGQALALALIMAVVLFLAALERLLAVLFLAHWEARQAHTIL